MKRAEKELELMSKEGLKAEWTKTCNALRSDQRDYYDVLARMKRESGGPISYLAEGEFDVGERYRETVEYLQLVGTVMHDRWR